MSSFNDSLEECLDKLYHYSSKFDVNIETIQKLAQQLKLDTFVDKDAYSHIFEPNVKNSDKTPSKFQRLSIAGSYILLDIDFTDVSKIINVSLSLANHISNAEEKTSVDLESQINIDGKDEEGNIMVNIGYGKNVLRFLTKGPVRDEASPEEIILLSLQSTKLGSFPLNLKLLATLDKFSSMNVDLFSYLDKAAQILQAAYYIETKQNSDWLYIEGFATNVGKISINDQTNSQLGIFVDFWQDYRYINYEYAKSNSCSILVGKSYKAMLNVKPSNYSQRDYSIDFKNSVWNLLGKDGLNENYKFVFNSDNHVEASSTSSSIKSSNKNNLNWILALDLNYPVFISSQVLEVFGITDYEEVNEELSDSDMFNMLNDYGEYNNNSSINKESPSKLYIRQKISQKYIALKSIALNALSELTQVIPVLRNFIVLANILRTLVKEATNNPSVFGASNRNGELSTEAKNRLKASLKLPDDVTDEELMGLSAVNDNSAFSTTQINRPNSPDLNSFMKDDLDELEKKPSIEELYILFSLDDIDYSTSGYDLLISIDGLLPDKYGELIQFGSKFKISNGVASEINSDKEDVDMDQDNEQITRSKKFVQGLNLTEDVIKVLQYVYLDK